MDERRRRRLAVAEGAGVDSEPAEEKSLPDCVPAEYCAAAPWIPRSLWKLWTLTALFLAGVAAVIVLTMRTPEFRPELAPALDPLFRGSQPRLVAYLETILWTLSGQLALLIGWHRSQSRLDFRGRYRFWPWVSATMFGCGLCVATDLHLGLGGLLGQWEFVAQQPPSFAWMLPAACLLAPLTFLVDRDIRRSLASVILLRFTLAIFVAGGIVATYGSFWIDPTLVAFVQSVCGTLGPALLTVTLWVHGWYVAYVTPDPPALSPGRLWRLPLAALRWMIGWVTWPFRRRTTTEASAPRRRKRTEDSTSPARRRRKAKRKPRTRTKVVEEEETEDEEYAEEDSAEDDEETAEETDEETAEETAEEELYEEEEPEPTPVRGLAPAMKSDGNRDSNPRAGQTDQRWSAAQQNSQPASSDVDEDEDDGEQWRLDGPSPEQLKGLSKRQRRALIKQHRDKQRELRGR